MLKLRYLLSQCRSIMGIIHGGKTYGGPLQANLSLTNKCNINCIHCYYHSPLVEIPAMRPVRRARINGTVLPDEQSIMALQKIDCDSEGMEKLLDELVSMGTVRFHFSGGGEPFMHSDAVSFIGRIKHAGCACDVNTNALLITSEIVDSLIRYKLDALKITVMAGTRDLYGHLNRGRTGNEFDLLKNNLMCLREKKASKGTSKPKVTLVCIVTSYNYRDTLNLAKFAADVGADSVHYRPIDAAGDSGLAQLIPSKEQVVVAKEQLVESKMFLESKDIEHNIENFFMVFDRKLDTKAFYDNAPCYYGWLSVSIDADGLLFFCCRGYEPMGNVFDDGFKNLWKGRKYIMKRKEGLSINRTKKRVSNCDCYSCIHYAANYKVFRLLHPKVQSATEHPGEVKC